MDQSRALAEARKSQLFFYSPYNFIRDLASDRQLQNCVFNVIDQFGNSPDNRVVRISSAGFEHLFYISHLPWDTNYFGFRTYRLRYVLYDHNDPGILADAVSGFNRQLFAEKCYCFIEIPSEDVMLMQALGANGFRLIETRLTYFRGNLDAFDQPRFAVRKATPADVPNLMRVAREMRNDFDRFHADPVFPTYKADEFLATYIEQSVNGFADVVLVPDEAGVPADSFLTAKYLKEEWIENGTAVSKMVLSAVSSATNKGWYKKLIAEMTMHLRDQGAQFIYMNTQSTNRAVIHTWESLGYRLGACAHVLSHNSL